MLWNGYVGKKPFWRAIAAAAIAVVFLSLSFGHASAAKTEMPVITIHAKRFAFTPPEITLKQGQTVELVFVADDVAHGISIKGLGIDLDLPKHKAQKVTVTPTKVGDFPGECSRYCGNGHDDMKFMVHVQP